MATVRQRAVLSGLVRITAGFNNQLRVFLDTSATYTTIQVPSGLYWLGFGGNDATARASRATDVVPFTVADDTMVNISGVSGSLLQELENQYSAWHWDLDVITGKLMVAFDQGGDQILWGDSATTMDPEWFGVAPGSSGYGTFTSSSGTGGATPVLSEYETVSDYQCSLCYCAPRQIERDDYRRVHNVISESYDNGARADTPLASYTSRQLSWRLNGIERDHDADRANMGRFLRRLWLSGQSFLYFPDVANSDLQSGGVDPYNPDSDAAAKYWGYERLVIAPEVRREFEPEELYELVGYGRQRLVCHGV